MNYNLKNIISYEAVSYHIVPFHLEGVIGADHFYMPEDSFWERTSMNIDENVFYRHIQDFLMASVTEGKSPGFRPNYEFLVYTPTAFAGPLSQSCSLAYVSEYISSDISLFGGMREKDRQQTRTVGILGDVHPHGIVGEQLFYQLGPFDETKAAAVEIVFIAHVVNFFNLLDAIEVEMVNEFGGGR